MEFPQDNIPVQILSVYDEVFQMVKDGFSAAGVVAHMLVGIETQSDGKNKLHILPVEDNQLDVDKKTIQKGNLAIAKFEGRVAYCAPKAP